MESQGEPRVVVSSIVPKGPADKEGQLMVGDNIISIDGHKVIGAKYEKVWSLRLQRRQRGRRGGGGRKESRERESPPIHMYICIYLSCVLYVGHSSPSTSSFQRLC